MTAALVLVERPRDGLAVVTLNRPEAMNALSTALRREIVAAFQALCADPTARVVVLTGAGRGFCAGLDLREIGADASKVVSEAADDPVAAVLAFTGPVIGAINGVAITGGLELALACDVRIASETARFADTHGRVGVMPGWGLSQKLSRMIGLPRAKEMAFTGNFVPAAKAEAWGLVNRVVSGEELMSEALALADDMLSLDPAMLPKYKALIDDGYALPFGEALALEAARANEHNNALSSGDLGARREAVVARGRVQT
ncbi:enoyl-CoA hydratase [Phenylobacterium sp.]|uniref:enoyl-CoA hydratase n=1 Tax=Phenylobacterium sp. TaxID=1871053 RepID=UPI0027350954|nr:enoyl-CoA hydratase [Phenylobacterium sp.]MDP3659996.1 enoyl-CoA hydratase [Phenylobacterium sp.]